MPWDQVEGATGRCKLGTRTYKKDGEEKKVNTVKKWLDPVEEQPAAADAEDDYE